MNQFLKILMATTVVGIGAWLGVSIGRGWIPFGSSSSKADGAEWENSGESGNQSGVHSANTLKSAQHGKDDRQAQAENFDAVPSVGVPVIETETGQGAIAREPRPKTLPAPSHALRLFPQLIQDCPGQTAFSCPEVVSLAKRIVGAPTSEESDWPFQIEQEIRERVLSRAAEFGFSGVDVKCSGEGCVLMVEGENGKMFAKGVYPHQNDEFEAWLNQSTWAPEFIGNGIGSNAASIMGWRVIGFASEPERIWYVLKRKE